MTVSSDGPSCSLAQLFCSCAAAAIASMIVAGVANPDASVGVYVPDGEAYSRFKELLDPIIQDYHGVEADVKQPPVDLGEEKLDQLEPLDPRRKYILSTRVRCARTVKVSTEVNRFRTVTVRWFKSVASEIQFRVFR